MWFLLRLVISVAAFFIRFLGKYLWGGYRGSKEISLGTTACYIWEHKSKSSVYATSFGIEFKSRSVFKLTPESSIDRLFKTLGIASEIQTGDHEFDHRVYIACDSSDFSRLIREDEAARQLIMDLFKADCKYICCDGQTLWVHFRGDQTTRRDLMETLAKLSSQLSKIDRQRLGFFRDPFVFKALVAESIVWSFATYAGAGFLEWTINKQDHYLDSFPLVRQGLFVGGFGALLALGLIVTFMKGSSRGHRILVESALVLGLCLPAGGMQAVSDINTQFDHSPSIWVRRKVYDVAIQEHRRRRGGRTYSYHLYLESSVTPEEFMVPQHIRVDYETFQRAARGATIEIEIGRGRLKHPWYRSFKFTKDAA